MTNLKDKIRDDICNFVAEYETDIKAVDEEVLLDEIMETITEHLNKILN